jgi:hypothetical protein
MRNFGDRWDFEECYKYKGLNNFDMTINRTVDLAKRAYQKDGEEVFFKILLSLSDWSQQVQIRLREESRHNKFEYEQLLRNSLGLHHEQLSTLLNDFITKRENAILMKHVPYNISPDTLLAKLDLDLRSIRKVFDYRVKAIKSEKKLIKMANEILLKEIMEQYLERERLESQGYILEGDPVTRSAYTPVHLLTKDVCDSCDHDLVSSTLSSSAACVFIGCGHTFHKHCMNIYHKESDNKGKQLQKCPKCSKDGALTLEQILESTKPRERRGTKRGQTESQGENNSTNELEDSQHSSSLMASSLDYSGYNKKLSDSMSDDNAEDSLRLLRIEQFDKLTFMGSLNSNNF